MNKVSVETRETPSEIVTLPNRRLFSSKKSEHIIPKENKKKRKRGNCQTAVKLSKKDLKNINNEISVEEQVYSEKRPRKKNNSRNKGYKANKNNKKNINNNEIIIFNENEAQNENNETKIFECLEEIRSTLKHSFDLFGNLVGLLKKEMNKKNNNNNNNNNTNNILLNKKTNRNKNKIQKFEKEETPFSVMEFDDYPRKYNRKRRFIDDDEDISTDTTNQKKKKYN